MSKTIDSIVYGMLGIVAHSTIAVIMEQISREFYCGTLIGVILIVILCIIFKDTKGEQDE